MRHVLHAAVVVLLLVGHVAAADTRWSLPADPQAVVVELQFVAPSPAGDQRSDGAPGERAMLVLRLRRDGSYEVNVQGGENLTGRLTDAELRRLVREIVEVQRGLALTSDGLTQALERAGRDSGKEWRIRNADTTVVRITLAGGTHEFRCCAPELLRTRFPQVEDLRRVCAIQRRLENLVAIARVGGKPEAERLAALAMAELRRQNGPDVKISAGDLLFVRGSSGDLRQCQFVVEPALRGETGAGIHVSVMESPGAAPRISMTPLSSAL
jgi:hypothetical protein